MHIVVHPYITRTPIQPNTNHFHETLLRNERAKDYVGCYEDNGSEDDDDEGADCQSAATYKQGFRDARVTLSTPIAIYENVRDVMASKRDSEGIQRPPPILTVVEDFSAQGCHFAYRMCQTSKYLLPQRRQRVYGVASQSEQRPDRMAEEFELAMTMMESHARWDPKILLIEAFLQEHSQNPQFQHLKLILEIHWNKLLP